MIEKRSLSCPFWLLNESAARVRDNVVSYSCLLLFAVSPLITTETVLSLSCTHSTVICGEGENSFVVKCLNNKKNNVTIDSKWKQLSKW